MHVPFRYSPSSSLTLAPRIFFFFFIFIWIIRGLFKHSAWFVLYVWTCINTLTPFVRQRMMWNDSRDTVFVCTYGWSVFVLQYIASLIVTSTLLFTSLSHFIWCKQIVCFAYLQAVGCVMAKVILTHACIHAHIRLHPCTQTQNFGFSIEYMRHFICTHT